MRRNKLTLKSVSEISLVDRGDNPKADVLIHKRAPTDPPAPADQPVIPAGHSTEPLHKRIAGAIAVTLAKLLGKSEGEVQKAYDEATTFGELDQGRRMRAAISEVYDTTYQLSDSLTSILRDPNLSDEERATMLATSLSEFTAAVTSAMPKWVAGDTTTGVEKADAKCAKCDKAAGEDGKCPDCGETIEKAGRAISAARMQRLTAMRDGLNELLTEVQPTTTEEPMSTATDATKNAPAPAGIPTTSTDDVLKGASPEIRSIVEKAQAVAAEALAKAEAAEERGAIGDFTKRLASGGDLYGLPGATAEGLRVLQKGLTPEQWTAHEALLKGSAEAIRQGGVFKEIGAGGDGGDTSVEKRIAAAADELRKAEPTLTPEQAFTKALNANPELYAEYQREQTRG